MQEKAFWGGAHVANSYINIYSWASLHLRTSTSLRLGREAQSEEAVEMCV